MILKAGAVQCGKIGRVNEKNQNTAIKGIHVVNKSLTSLPFKTLLPLAINTNAMIIMTKLTGLLYKNSPTSSVRKYLGLNLSKNLHDLHEM